MIGNYFKALKTEGDILEGITILATWQEILDSMKTPILTAIAFSDDVSANFDIIRSCYIDGSDYHVDTVSGATFVTDSANGYPESSI